MADSSEDESSDSSDNLSVVSDEDFVVSSSSEASVREDEVEIEQGSAISRPLSGKRKSSQPRSSAKSSKQGEKEPRWKFCSFE